MARSGARPATAATAPNEQQPTNRYTHTHTLGCACWRERTRLLQHHYLFVHRHTVYFINIPSAQCQLRCLPPPPSPQTSGPADDGRPTGLLIQHCAVERNSSSSSRAASQPERSACHNRSPLPHPQTVTPTAATHQLYTPAVGRTEYTPSLPPPHSKRYGNP